MFNVLMEIPGGHEVQMRGGSGALCRRLTQWGIGWEKVSDTLVKNQRTKKEGQKIPTLASIGPMTNSFLQPPFQVWEDADIKGLLFLILSAVWCKGGAP